MISIYTGKTRGLGSGESSGGYAKLNFEFRDHIQAFTAISESAFPIFVCLMLHSNEDGWSWPSRELIAAETGYTVDTVSATIAKLKTATVDGKRLLVAYQPPQTPTGMFASNRYLIFPSPDEVAKQEKPQASPPEPEAPLSPEDDDAEVNGRVLENPLKPITRAAAVQLGRSMIRAKSKREQADEVAVATGGMLKIANEVGCMVTCWSDQEVKDAVRAALDRGEDKEILAVKFENFIATARKKVAGSWTFMQKLYVLAIINSRVEPRKAQVSKIGASSSQSEAEETFDPAFLNGDPPSPVDDPEGNARWIRGVAMTMFNGNMNAARRHYERTVSPDL
jgi:hypothetical protein